MRLLRARAAVFVAFLSLTAASIANTAHAQGANSDPQPTGSARITGRVLALDDGRPVRRAVVTLSGSATGTQSRPAYLQKETETDEDGAFRFVGLPSGRYYINAGGTNGFVELARAKQVTVEEGRSIEIQIRLERTGAIVGRIADRNGEGLLGVEVFAVRRSEFRGRVTLMAGYGSRSSTDDLGQFRLFNLPPGEYFVVATPPLATRPVDSRRDNGATRRSGFLKTYYPGKQTVQDARLLVVRPGKEVRNVNVSLASGPLLNVTVEAVDSHGQPLGREASATLNLVSEVYLPSSMRHANRAEGGPFLFREVPPGDYYLIVNTSYRQEEAAYLEVEVGGDVTLKVQTNSGATVSGRFVVQGVPRQADNGEPTSNVVMTATPPPGWTGPAYAKNALVQPQGTDRFELAGLRGPMVLDAQMAGALLASISRAGGENLAGKTIDFTGTERIDDLLVVFTHDKADVEITVTGLREPDDPENVLVILFPQDATGWHSGSLRYTFVEASAEMRRQMTDGRAGRVFPLSLGPVIPGRYLVAAVPNPGVMYPTERDVLERLRPLAVPVTLAAGETAKVELPVRR